MVKSIIVKEIRLALKDKGTYFWTFALPILFIVIFASVFGNIGESKITVHYIDVDQTSTSKQFIDTIAGIDGFVLQQKDEAELEAHVAKIRDGKLSSLVVIPKGFEQEMLMGTQAEVVLYRDATVDASVTPIQAVLQNIANGYREGKLAQAFAITGMESGEVHDSLLAPIEIKEVKENATKLNYITQIVPGYTVMFVFFIMITMTNNFIKDRDSGMIGRLRSTPMRPLSYLVGMWVPSILIVLIQAITLLAFGHFVYDLHLGDLLSISLIVITLAICVTGIGLALALFLKSANQGVAFAQIITMGGAILGGLWFPIDMMPEFVQRIGKFVPQYWAQQGFQDVMLRDAHIGDIWLNLSILFAFGFVGLLIASLRYKRFLQNAVN